MKQITTPQENARAEKSNQLRRRRLIITVIIALVGIIVIAITQILSNLGLLPSFWATVSSSITGLLGVIFAFLALLPILFPAENTAQPIHIHLPQNAAHQGSTHTIIAEHPDIIPGSTPQSLPTSAAPRKYRKIVGALPAISPLTIHQREETVKQIYACLLQPDISAVVLTGIGGVGKSTLAALVYNFIERQQQEHPFFKGASIWLTVDAGVTMADLVGTVFEVLDLPIPDLEHLTPSNQALVLFDALKKTDKTRLLVLDQFENFLDWQTGHALEGRFGVDEWLDVLNSRDLGSPGCRVLLTSRILPRGAHEYPFTYLQEYPVQGLAEAEGIELLKKLSSGAIKATHSDLCLAVERCNGHAYALTLLASLLRDHNLSLTELFKDPLYMELWEGDLASKMLDYIYRQQLTEAHRSLLLAFSVYRRAVPLGAAQAVIDIDQKLSHRELSKTLKILLNLHLLQVSGEGRYQLHAIVIGYAHKHFDEENEQQNTHLLHAAYEKAAHYYQQLMTEKQHQSIEDVQPLIEAVWELCKAEQWKKAYTVMVEEKLIEDLNRLGGSLILLELYQNLFPLSRWQPTTGEKANIYKNLGQVHYQLGELTQALDDYYQALHTYHADANIDGQGDILFFLGEVYHGIGPIEKSLTSYEEALNLYQQKNNRKGIALTFTNLCWVYASMGQLKKALDFGQQALSMYVEMNDHWGESRCYDALAQVYNNMEQQEQAQHYLERALHLYRELGNHWQEGWMHIHLGKLKRNAADIPQAQQLFQQALTTSQYVKNPWVESAALLELGNICFALDQTVQASEHYNQALATSRAVNDRWGESRALNALGQFQSHHRQQKEALKCFWQAITICQEIGNYVEESTSLCEIAEICIDKEHYIVALASLVQAKNIYLTAQNPCPHRIQEMLDRLCSILGAEQYTTLITQVETQAIQHKLIEQLIKAS